jgi:hypothetical protein
LPLRSVELKLEIRDFLLLVSGFRCQDRIKVKGERLLEQD